MKLPEARLIVNERSLNMLWFVWMGIAATCTILFFQVSTWREANMGPANLELQSVESLTHKFAVELEKLEAEPLQFERLVNLSTFAKALGDYDQSRKFAELAARRNARDFSAQKKLIDQLLADGGYAEALSHMDGVLRAQPGENVPLFTALVALLQQEKALMEVVKVLAMAPPWRDNFINFVSHDVKNIDALYGLFAALRKNNLPISDREIRTCLKSLLDHQDVERAYFIWLDLLNEKQLRNVKLLYDGAFSAQSQNLFFDWTVRTTEGVDVAQVERKGGSGDQSLELDFTMARPHANMIEQIVLLPAGDYVFSGESKTKNLSSDLDLQWQVRCAEKTSPVAKLSSSGSHGEWTAMAADFTVPAENCLYQKIVLRSADASPISGQVYFDNLRIVRKSSWQ